MLYIYYNNEVKMVKDACNMELSNASMQIEAEIMNAHMNKIKFDPQKFAKEGIRYALYDKNQKQLYSYLQGNEFIDFNRTVYEDDHYNFYITELKDKRLEIRYIVVETCEGIQDRNKLKIYVMIALVLSAVFIGFIAYFLAKILLKPVREKVEHMDKFIKDSAHELNTPIAVLMTSVSMLKKGKNPEKMMKYILSSTKQISQIYNDIHFSAFNEINDDVFEEFNLKDLVGDSVEYFNDISITKNIKIQANLEDCNIMMDRTKTQKIVNNLISNAIKYSNKDSNVVVCIKDNILSIQDFGIGISEQDQKDIFKRYKRGNNIEGGFGIGLDIVKRICSEYDLILALNSKLDEGSIFYVDFRAILNGAKCDLPERNS